MVRADSSYGTPTARQPPSQPDGPALLVQVAGSKRGLGGPRPRGPFTLFCASRRFHALAPTWTPMNKIRPQVRREDPSWLEEGGRRSRQKTSEHGPAAVSPRTRSSHTAFFAYVKNGPALEATWIIKPSCVPHPSPSSAGRLLFQPPMSPLGRDCLRNALSVPASKVPPSKAELCSSGCSLRP